MFSAKNKKLIKTKFNEFKAEADGLTDQSSKGRALRSIQQFDSVFKSLQGLVSLIDVSIRPHETKCCVFWSLDREQDTGSVELIARAIRSLA
jgi:hypothetical protein